MQQMPRQTAMQQAMPAGAPAQSNKGGLGALAAQRQQGGQADPRLMEMFKRLQGGIPGSGQMPQGPQMGFGQGMQVGQPGGFGQMDPRAMAAMQAFQNQGGGMRTQEAIPLGGPGFGQAPTQAAMQMGHPPSGFDAFMQQRQQQDAMNAQRAMQNGTMPQFQDQMRQRDMAMQGITQADIDRVRNLQMSGDPSFQAESDALNARANANRMSALQGQFGAQGGMPGMAAPGGGLFPGAQRPLPVGAGGKGGGKPPRQAMFNPRGQAAQPVDPRLAMMMRGRMR